MFCKNAIGKLKADFDGGRNAWRTLDDMKDEPKKYKSFEQEMHAGIEGIPFTEVVHHYSGEEF